MFIRILVQALLGAALLHTGPAAAQGYPSRPISLTVPYAAGGVSDLVGRAFAQRLAAQMGQAVVVENKPGASGNLGSAQVARAAPDGYQLLAGSSGPQAINVALIDRLPYDPVKDLAPVAMFAVSPIVLVVPENARIRTVAELLAAIRASRVPMSYSSAGNASTPHLAGEYFRQLAGVELTHVPYKGDAPALADVVGGHVQMSFPALASALPLIKGGKLRALAVTSPQRSALLSNVPTMREAGLPQYEMVGWFGLFAPKDTHTAVLSRLANEVRTALADDKLREQLAAVGVEPANVLEGAAFGRFQQDQIAKFGALVKSARITIE